MFFYDHKQSFHRPTERFVYSHKQSCETTQTKYVFPQNKAWMPIYWSLSIRIFSTLNYFFNYCPKRKTCKNMSKPADRSRPSSANDAFGSGTTTEPDCGREGWVWVGPAARYQHLPSEVQVLCTEHRWHGWAFWSLLFTAFCVREGFVKVGDIYRLLVKFLWI